MHEKLKVFEAFSGYGSQSIALRNIGVNYEVVAISEIDKYALIAYDAIHNNNEKINIPSEKDMLDILKQNNIGFNFKLKKLILPTKDIQKIYLAHKRSKNLGDISNIENIPKHDLFTYSFPCQDISSSGKLKGFNKESNTKSSLLWKCTKIIESCKPKYLLMENVKNIVNKTFKPDFNLWLQYLEQLGYKNFWKIINAKDHNIPQNRERVFVISILNSNYQFPQTQDLTVSISDLLENNIRGNTNNIIVDNNIPPCVRVNFEREKNLISKSTKNMYTCKSNFFFRQ